MPKHGWTILCNRLIVDEETKKANLIDIFDRLNLTSDKELREAIAAGNNGIKLPMAAVCVSWWFRTEPQEPERGKARFRLEGPDGKNVAMLEYPLDLTEHFACRRAIVFSDFPVSALGYYWLMTDMKVGKKWKEVARLPLEVALIPSEP